MSEEVDVTAPPVQPGEERVELHVIHTPCKECVFAEYGQSGTTATQGDNGCELGRLKKYREQGTEIVGAYDEDCEFNIINGRQCPAYRDRRSEWAKHVPAQNRAAAVRAEMTIRTDILVYLDDGDLGALGKTFDSLRQLVLKPSSVTVVNNQGKLNPGRVIAALNKAGQGLNWQLVDIREKRNDGTRVDIDRAVDIAAAKLKGHFYAVVPAGEEVSHTLTLDLDRAVVDDMGRFVVVLPTKPGEHLLVSLGFHNAPMVNGNKAVPVQALDETWEGDSLLHNVVEKALYLAKYKDSPHLVVYGEKFCSA